MRNHLCLAFLFAATAFVSACNSPSASPDEEGLRRRTGGRGGRVGTGGTGGSPGTGGSSATGGAGGAPAGATGGATGGAPATGGTQAPGTGGGVATGGATGGAGATTGTGGATSGALRAAPLAEYLVNEASSGSAPTTLRDAQPAPLNLGIVYAGGSPVFSTDAHGRALAFPVGDVRFAGAFSPALDVGNKLRDAIHGSTTATLEVLADVDWSHNTAYIFQIFGFMQEDGENDDLSLWRWDDRLEYDFTSASGYPAGYFKRSVAISGIAPGPHLFHVVLDTNATSPADRLRLYVDGVRPPAVSPNEGGQTIPAGVAVALPRPGESLGATGPAHYQTVSLGGLVDYYAGTGGFRGRIYYAAIHKNALTAAEIQAAPARIGIGD